MSIQGTALVTGGAKRIGGAIVLALAAKGCDIAIHCNYSKEEADRLKKEIQFLGRKCEVFCCNLGDMKQVAGLIPTVTKVFPDLRILVNNASVFERGGFLDSNEDFFDKTLNVNFKAPYLLSRYFAKYSGKGSIVNILDTKITKNIREHFVYAMSKKALAEFTTMAAKDLAPNIRVNAVCPGLILPPSGEGVEYLEKKSQSIPMKTFGSTKDIASAVCFLIENEFLTGEFVFVDGGEHLL